MVVCRAMRRCVAVGRWQKVTFQRNYTCYNEQYIVYLKMTEYILSVLSTNSMKNAMLISFI